MEAKDGALTECAACKSPEYTKELSTPVVETNIATDCLQETHNLYSDKTYSPPVSRHMEASLQDLNPDLKATDRNPWPDDKHKSSETVEIPLSTISEHVQNGGQQNAGEYRSGESDKNPSEDDQSKKAHPFGKLLGKRTLTCKKDKKPRMRASSLCDMNHGRQGSWKSVTDPEKASILQTDVNEHDKALDEADQTGNLRTTGSRSVHICCGMSDGLGDHGMEMEVTKDTEYDLGIDRWSVDAADNSSIDGSRFSDSSGDDLDFDAPSQPFQGNGSTDTDTDDATGPKPKQAPFLAREQRNSLAERVGQVPALLVYYTQIIRELHWHRLYLNHYETIDFSVFEFGSRRGFLLWRCACLVLVSLILVETYIRKGIDGLNPSPGRDLDLCLHVWLTWLLFVQLVLEVSVLGVEFFLYPTCYLARVHTTPLHWKIVWFLNNVTLANILSLVLMHAIVFKGSDTTNFGAGARIHLALTCLSLTHATLSAMPVRLAHVLHPALLTLTFIVYVNVARPCSNFPRYIPGAVFERKELEEEAEWAGGAEGAVLRGRLAVDVCYLEPIMWTVNRTCCVLFTCLWMNITSMCHCGLVFLCWCRRVVFRHRRENSVAVYGQSPTTCFYPEFGAEVSPHMARMVEDDGFRVKDFVTGCEHSPPFRSMRVRRRWLRRKSALEDGVDL